MNKYSSKFCWNRSSEEEQKKHLQIVIDDNIKWNGQCLEWKGYKDKGGYGRIKYFKRILHVTRIIWYLNHGKFEEELVICHKCDNPKCVLIDHLFIGTVQDNTRDAFQKGRRTARRGEKSNFAKLTEVEVKKIKIMLREKISESKIGKMFGVSRGTINDISRKRNWKHVNP